MNRESITEVERILCERKMLNALNNLFVNEKSFHAFIFNGIKKVSEYFFYTIDGVTCVAHTFIAHPTDIEIGLNFTTPFIYSPANVSIFRTGMKYAPKSIAYRNNSKKWTTIEVAMRDIYFQKIRLKDFVL